MEAFYRDIVHLVGARTGLAFAPNRWDTVRSGIQRAMARAGADDLARYCRLLITSEQILDDLIVELTVGETYFFRDPAQFAVLRRRILPDIRARRPRDHVIRAWSAGCASGEEAYSLAIVLTEEGCEPVRVLATDISRPALAKARAGIYGRWSLRGDAAAAAHPYLRQQGDDHVLDEPLRRHVTFEHLNLALDVYPSLAGGVWAMDLILCRNVLIYLDPLTVRQVARRFFDALAPGGWLVTSACDPPLRDAAPYEVVVTADAGLLYRRPETPLVTITPPPLVPPRSAPATLRVTSPPPIAPEPRRADAPSTQVDLLGDARAAFARGDYATTVALTRDLTGDPAASALYVRGLANLDVPLAARACADAAGRHPLVAELHYLRAVLLMDLRRDEEAAESVRRVLYLDRSLAAAHFTLATILRRTGDLAGARRAYGRARDLCAARPPDEPVPLADGAPADLLRTAAEAQVALLDVEGRRV
jgi:chemotaxis protein methyltransferase CheR